MGGDIGGHQPSAGAGRAGVRMMLRFRILAAKVGAWFSRRKADHESDYETQMHLQLLAERFIGQGMRPEEAASAARRQFGNPALLQQRRRDMRSIMLVANLERDVGPTEGGGLRSTAFSYPVFEELRKKTDVFRDLIAFKDIQLTVTVDGNPELIAGEMVSGDTFSGLGVEPILGRPITRILDGFGRHRVGASRRALACPIS